MSAYDYDQAVATGIARLDEAYPGSAWRMEMLFGRNLPRLWERIARIAEPFAPDDPAISHDWHLQYGLTIDYSGLGYPLIGGDPTPRVLRELRAYAELEAAWWRALVPGP